MEHQNIEWKESWRDEYLKWICGFANAQGGIIYIGKKDDGTVIHVRDAERLLEDIPNKVKDILGILVDVNLLDESGKKYIEIKVDPYPYPINFKGQYHYRSGSTKQELTGNALNRFIMQKAGKHWDGVPLPELKVDHLDEKAFELFRKKAEKSKRIDEEMLKEDSAALLKHLHLFEGNFLKRAAGLLFYRDPEEFFTGAYVKIGFFENEAEIIYHDEIHGNLLQQADKTMEILLSKYLKAKIGYEGINRVESFPYPEPALREAVINAIAHKEYSSGAPIQIKVFDSKLRIWNHGQLPYGWNLEKLITDHPSNPNNPDIANALFRAGIIESWGRGIAKIIKQCESAGLPAPLFNTDFGGFQIEFKARQTIAEAVETYSDTVRDKYGISTGKIRDKYGITASKIVGELIRNKYITLPQIAENLNISLSTVEKGIRLLKNENLIKRMGSKKDGYWEAASK